MELKTHGYFLPSLALRVFPPRSQTQLLPLAQAHFLSMSPPWFSWFIDSSSMISHFLSPKKKKTRHKGCLFLQSWALGPWQLVSSPPSSDPDKRGGISASPDLALSKKSPVTESFPIQLTFRLRLFWGSIFWDLVDGGAGTCLH